MNRVELEPYVESIERLQQALERLREFRARAIDLQEQIEQIEGLRQAHLDLAVSEDDADQSTIATLTEHSTRINISTERLRNIQGRITESEVTLQSVLVEDVAPAIMKLYRAWLDYKYKQGRKAILDLLDPTSAMLTSTSVDQLTWATKNVAQAYEVSIFLPDGIGSPLSDTYSGSMWSARRKETIALVVSAAEQVIPQAQTLLRTVDLEDDFEIPAFTPPEPVPAPERSTRPPPGYAPPEYVPPGGRSVIPQPSLLITT
jgi:hypothetical protein